MQVVAALGAKAEGLLFANWRATAAGLRASVRPILRTKGLESIPDTSCLGLVY